MMSSEEPIGRRAVFSLVGSCALVLVAAACAGAGGEPPRRSGRGRRRDDVPFWHREEQRDD